MGKIERIQVSPKDRERLCELVKDRNTPQKIVWRSQIVLLAGEGVGAVEVATRVGKSVLTVRRWRRRMIRSPVGTRDICRSPETKMNPPLMTTFMESVVKRAQLLTKARILLKTDVSDAGAGWSDSGIVAALDTSIATVERTRRQSIEEGFEAVLPRKYNPKSARPRIFDGAAEAKLIALGLFGPGWLRPMEPSPARGEGRRTKHCRARQRQHDRPDA